MNGLTIPAPLLWTPEQSGRCACGTETQYRDGIRKPRFLIRDPEPAWDMKEFIHNDRACISLTERTRFVFRKVYELGAQHVGDSRTSYKGTPDWHLWPREQDQHGSGRELEHVFIELKVMRSETRHDPSEDQVRVMTELGRISPVYLCRPCCLLNGTIDRILCHHFGGEPRSSYADGLTELPVFSSRAPADRRAHAAAIADMLAPATRPAPAATAPAVEPPGEPGLPDHAGPAEAIVIPQPGDNDAIREVEAWLRASGFPPINTRYPLRILVSAQIAVVECSTGRPVRAGQPAPREWRWALTRFRFPIRLATTLDMIVTSHPSITAAATAAADTHP